MQGARVHRAEDITVLALDPTTIEDAAARLERRTALTIPLVDGQLFLSVGEAEWTVPLTVRRLG